MHILFFHNARTLGIAIVTFLVMLVSGLLAILFVFLSLNQFADPPPILIAILFGGLFGSLVGCFRAWSTRSLFPQQSLFRWLILNIFFSIAGPIIFILLFDIAFPLNIHIMEITGLGFGLLYGLLFSSIVSVAEWWVLRPYVAHRWQSAIISLIGWSGWWAMAGVFMSMISGMD